MPKLELSVTVEQLQALLAGEATALTATLRIRAVKAASAPLSPEERARQERVVDAWYHEDPEMNPGRVWKALKPLSLTGDEIALGIVTAFDWCRPKPVVPETFAKQAVDWLRRGEMDVWDAETERHAYRQRIGLPG